MPSGSGIPAAAACPAIESSSVRRWAGPSSGSQYARLSPTQPTVIAVGSTTAQTKVEAGGLGPGSGPAASTAAAWPAFAPVPMAVADVAIVQCVQ